jgi:isoleucyl-tRNA synthetase
VRRNRRRFWKSESDEDKLTAYLVLYECLAKLIELVAAIMPFLTEEMYQNLVRQVDKDAASSIHLCDFPLSDRGLIDEKLEKEVALTRTIVSLGRSARSKANMKIRQPLSEMIVSMPEDHLRITEDDMPIILEELNIKQLKEVEKKRLNELSELKVTPRFDQLGPKFGKDAGQVAKTIKSLDQDEIDKLMKNGSLKKDINGSSLEITSGDVDVKRIGKDGWAIASDGELGVGVNTSVTEELKNEGLVRELIHKIQLMRKEAGFDLTDRIKISFETGQELARAINVNIDYLKTETLAVDVCEGLEAGETKNVLNINGIETTIVLQRIKPA